MPETRLILGCMTGTSIDALDAALVRIHGRGLSMRAEVVRTISHPLGPIARSLRQLAQGAPIPAGDLAHLAWRFGEIHAECIAELLRNSPGDPIRPDLIALHGQTIYHRPPYSLQLMNPTPIAHAHRTPIICDMRQADLAAGGQGAPITPLADAILFHTAPTPCCIANLGGFCNITRLQNGDPSQRITGQDVCACNQLLDAIARERLLLPYDKDGSAALAGWANDDAAERLADLLEEQASSGRSLGTGDELEDWMRDCSHLTPEDMAATACQAIGRTIARAIGDSRTLLLAGGGLKNAALVRAIAGHSRADVHPTDEFGIPSSHREAVAMAVLGALCADRVPITIPQITGSTTDAMIAGLWVLP